MVGPGTFVFLLGACAAASASAGKSSTSKHSATSTSTKTSSARSSSTALPWPKEMAVTRRRSGLTHKEYLYYHTLVHGAKAWNAPRDVTYPESYYLNYCFDSVVGANDSVADPVYAGRDDVTELYSSYADSFTSSPSTNYTETVIGPDGANFNDEDTAFSMLAYEIPVAGIPTPPKECVKDDGRGPVTAHFWAASTDESINNATFAANLADAIVANLTSGTIWNATYHYPVPGSDLRAYYGGYDMPMINAVVKLWLCNTDAAVTSVRATQTSLKHKSLSLDIDSSFFVFGRAVAVYDLSKNIAFSIDRLTAFLKLHTSY